MRALDSLNEASSSPDRRSRKALWPELTLIGLSVPAILDEALRWLRPPSDTMSAERIWFLVELFGSLAVGVLGALLAPVIAGIAIWGIATGRWRGLRALGAYALVLVNMRALLIMCFVFANCRGAGPFHLFAIVFLLVVPSVYLGIRAWRTMRKHRAA
jgi:hypothetical protein